MALLQSEALAASWAPYVPSPAAPWDLRRVVHLHRRAGFAATWNELQRDLKEGPEASVGRILAGKARMEGVPADFDYIAAVIGDAAVASGNASRLKAWWVYRMLFSADPLAERLALGWHNHFATSNLKLNDVAAMRRQNEIFRESGRGKFGELLRRVVHDPALLNWLDAPANRKEHPNENLGRELMELFTLGEGHFTETDVKEAARALTGWTLSAKGEFREVTERHDEGEKTVLGRKGAWRGDDLVAILLEQPATADRLAMRLCELFFGEEFVAAAKPVRQDAGREAGGTPTHGSKFSASALIGALADGLRERQLDIGWGVETILRSHSFFADGSIGRRVLPPAEFVVGAVRVLEPFDRPPSTLVLAEWISRLGQDLFYPPNVFGWPGGRSWITSRSMVARANFASALVKGGVGGRTDPLDVAPLLQRQGRGTGPDETIAFFGDLLLGGGLSNSLKDDLKAVRDSSKENEADTARRLLSTLLASPDAQLG